ncbi:MAG: alpha/beta hydrolase [Bacteroidales bacterium]|nr:alpha/beta hydrolase [Bacteroidales bacterium]MBQ9586740.1 alpha/beta hydrolase [Bacteroidales bacterium]MBR0304060.1 alpha/beta hydrolase [Bacteroidales bacterium]
MKNRKIKGEAKSVMLPNGQEVVYCERGAEHEEVMIMGAFYFHTAMPMIESLSERFHVYGVVMRISGESDQKNADGTVHWGNTWGKEMYEFAQVMGIKKFHYLGKCHSTVPGWWLVKNHPELLIDFCSFYMAPHLKPQTANEWFDTLEKKGPWALMSKAMRKKSGIFKKMIELASLGKAAKQLDASVGKYASSPELVWDSLEECEADLRQLDVPVYFLFGSEDIVFHDHYDSTMYAKEIVRGAKFTILPGERHLLELDCPERVAEEAFAFIDEVKNK